MATPIEFRMKELCSIVGQCVLVFPIELPNTNYTVNVEASWETNCMVTEQSTTGCKVTFYTSSPGSTVNIHIYWDVSL